MPSRLRNIDYCAIIQLTLYACVFVVFPAWYHHVYVTSTPLGYTLSGEKVTSKNRAWDDFQRGVAHLYNALEGLKVALPTMDKEEGGAMADVNRQMLQAIYYITRAEMKRAVISTIIAIIVVFTTPFVCYYAARVAWKRLIKPTRIIVAKFAFSTPCEAPNKTVRCAVCQDRIINARFDPCGHTACSECFVGNEKLIDCHMCRAHIEKIEPLFIT